MRVANAVPTNLDACAIGVLLLWSNFVDDLCVGDIESSVSWNVVVLDYPEGVRTFNSFW